MGEHDQDQDDVAEPARPTLGAAQAREMTAGLREAMDDVRRSVAVLAARVRDAHAARVWTPLGHPSWEAYCEAELGISRAQAYRLLDVARSLAAIHGAVAAGTETSRTRDSDPAAAAALDYGLSQRALSTVSSRSGDVAELITRRLATLAHSGLQALETATVRAVVRQAVRDIRTAPPPPPAEPPTDPTVAARRRVVDDLAASTHAIGELMLEVAPTYLSDTEAATGILTLLCDQNGEPLEHGDGAAASRFGDLSAPVVPVVLAAPAVVVAERCGQPQVQPDEAADSIGHRERRTDNDAPLLGQVENQAGGEVADREEHSGPHEVQQEADHANRLAHYGPQ
ncbi:hypothetical protein [Streptomyces sp. NPDC058335]|uniref:hypothetical protein n=1 Tax=Streptomyces sp. NPDC058335 TaxID=3346451 RepID=UPI003669C0B6